MISLNSCIKNILKVNLENLGTVLLIIHKVRVYFAYFSSQYPRILKNYGYDVSQQNYTFATILIPDKRTFLLRASLLLTLRNTLGQRRVKDARLIRAIILKERVVGSMITVKTMKTVLRRRTKGKTGKRKRRRRTVQLSLPMF